MTPTEFLLARIRERLREADRRGKGSSSNDDVTYWIRVLAECDAQRRIVELHRIRNDIWAHDSCDVCVDFHGREECENKAYPCPTMRILATVYSDHPDWREEWRA